MNILRWIFGSYYLLVGIAVALSLLGVIPGADRIDFGKGINDFIAALERTGFALGALAVTYTVAGALILSHKTAHLGIVILAPAVVMIFLTHLFVEEGAPVWGSLHMAILMALAWQYRHGYASLFDFNGTAAMG
ncbi:hypothetical protein HBA55_21590 [Pseudomaricurvus alkylphenolicus]|uniref:hypothetical protein n=1 Tax=Pseudomaricurvus alkylphenolicus TaxID=1306991 RepID=UPI00141FB96A|nr:hypothetical protein [Pseudomaricurvus alkylphenolicus]NIB42215.1 hypothetical protein [Pseudomaricurvus alkylphenolicus]